MTNEHNHSMQNYKIVLIGNGNTGKTTWLKFLMTHYFDQRYVPTLGVEVHPYEVERAEESVVLNFWDCAGQERFGGLRDGYYICANAAIVFHDLTPDKWQRGFKRVCETEPIIHVFSKCETLTNEQMDEILSKYPDAIFLSTKDQLNVLAPINALLNHLV